MALAADVERYTASKNVQQLRADLSMLPVWLARKNSRILAADTDINRRFIESVRHDFPILSNVEISHGDSNVKPMPWGWSRSVRSELRHFGVTVLPGDELLAQLRRLSSRQTSVEILQSLKKQGFPVPEMPVVCTSVAEAEAAVNRFGKSVMKTPWSSSGRGVAPVSSATLQSKRSWIEGALRRQGMVVCEPLLQKEQDFALEFYADCGKVEFCGYSMFFTDTTMSYDHALVASTQRMRERLSAHVDLNLVDRLQRSLQSTLSALLPSDYEGYVGVDMMAYRDDGELRVDPCIELNLRTTMGVVSSVLGDDILRPDAEATMTVRYYRTVDEIRQVIGAQKAAVIEDGRLIDGLLRLTPVDANTNFIATLAVTNS